MTARVSNVAAINDVKNAVLAPGMIQPLPNQLNAFISFVLAFRESSCSQWCGGPNRVVASARERSHEVVTCTVVVHRPARHSQVGNVGSPVCPRWQLVKKFGHRRAPGAVPAAR